MKLANTRRWKCDANKLPAMLSNSKKISSWKKEERKERKEEKKRKEKKRKERQLVESWPNGAQITTMGTQTAKYSHASWDTSCMMRIRQNVPTHVLIAMSTTLVGVATFSLTWNSRVKMENEQMSTPEPAIEVNMPAKEEKINHNQTLDINGKWGLPPRNPVATSTNSFHQLKFCTLSNVCRCRRVLSKNNAKAKENLQSAKTLKWSTDFRSMRCALTKWIRSPSSFVPDWDADQRIRIRW